MLKKFFIFIVLLQVFSAPSSFAETDKNMQLIDLDRVAPSVKKRMLQFGVDQFISLDQFTLSCGDSINPKDYHFNSMTFDVDADVDQVWQTYLSSNPKDTWSGDNIQFDFAYSKEKKEVYYRDSTDLPPLQVGMGFYIVLKIAGIAKLPVGLEISKIDSKEKIFEYTYLNANASHGKQIVHFRSIGPNKTRIEHNTYFKSDSKFRDRLYPIFHESLLEEFHQNVLNILDVKAIRIQ